MPLMHNDKGEFLSLGNDGQWAPAQMMNNPETGEVLVLDDNKWVPVLQSAGKTAFRAADQLAGGFSDAIYNTAAAIPEFVGMGLRAIHPSLAPREGFYREGLKNVAQTVGSYMMPEVSPDMGPRTPQNQFEKTLRATGEGVGNAASMIVPAAAVGRLAQAGSKTQQVARALASQPAMQATAGAIGGAVTESTDSPMAGMAASIVGVPLAAALGRRIITPVNTRLTGEEARLAAIAERNGIRLTPGQATGSRPLQAMESSLTTLPFASGAQRGIYDTEARELNRAILRQAGINADDASPHVLERAFTDIGQEFDALVAQTNVTADPQFFQGIDRAANKYMRRLNTNVRPAFQSYIDDINQMRQAAAQPGVTNVSVDGKTYQNIASDLRTAARKQQTTDPNYALALEGLVNSLDDAMERASGPSVRAGWRDVRDRYRNLLAINNAMTAGTQVSRTTGNIPAGSFTQKVKDMDKGGYGRGRGSRAMNDLSRVGDFIAQKIPNSGTPERQQAMQILQGGFPVSAGGVGYALSGGDPLTAIISGLMTYGLPPLAQALINSRAGQAYLRNQVMPAPQNPGWPGVLSTAKILAPQSVEDDRSAARRAALAKALATGSGISAGEMQQ